MITRAEAEEILAAFGPCPVLCETQSVEEVLESIGDHTPREFIELSITVEDVMGDRMAATARAQEESGEPQYKDQHLHVVADEVEFLKLLKGRCTALMARKGW